MNVKAIRHGRQWHQQSAEDASLDAAGNGMDVLGQAKAIAGSAGRSASTVPGVASV
jgi:hypothetical protein